MTKVDRLIRQLEVQEQTAAATGSLAASLQGGEEASAARLDRPPLVVTPAPMGTPPAGLVRTGVLSTGATQRSTLLSDLATLHWDGQACGNSAQPSDCTPFSAADSASGVSSITNMAPDRPSALNSSTYTPHPHNTISTNKINEIQGTAPFRISPQFFAGEAGPARRIGSGYRRVCHLSSTVTESPMRTAAVPTARTLMAAVS
jgi:hypothetical protein